MSVSKIFSVKYTRDCPYLEGKQRLYIPLTFVLRDDSSSHPLRVCGNASFRSWDNLTLNEVTISGPNFQANLQGILIRWQMAERVAIGDILRCYHQIKTSALDNSLRRTYVRKEGLGSDTPWEEVAFQTVSFGDILGGPISSIAIDDCANQFMTEPAKSRLRSNIYMDDACVGARGTENLEVMVNEIDRGLKQANFVVKKWTKTYDQDQVPELYSYSSG